MQSSSRSTNSINVAIGCLYKEVPNWNGPENASPYRFLLIKRRDKYINELDNKWELPGGKVEPNESYDETVEREFLEETGYEVRAINQLGRFYTYTRKYPDVDLRVTLICYICTLKSDHSIEPMPDPKIGDITWFDPNEINYRQTLQGSREFIVDVANYLGIEINAQVEKCTYLAEYNVLKPNTVQAKKRLGRHYTVTIQFNARNNEYYLMTHGGGKVRNSNRPKVETFDEYSKMISKAKERISLRHYHGYSLTKFDKDFPSLIGPQKEVTQLKKVPIMIKE